MIREGRRQRFVPQHTAVSVVSSRASQSLWQVLFSLSYAMLEFSIVSVIECFRQWYVLQFSVFMMSVRLWQACVCVRESVCARVHDIIAH